MQQITLENIKKIQKHRYFDAAIINKELYKKTLLLMREAYGVSGNEALLLMCNQTYEYRTTSQNKVDIVSLNDEMLSALRNVDDFTYTAFHNHTDDATFSLGDLKMLLEYEKLTLLILCTNSCKYSAALYKTDSCKKYVLKMLAYILDLSFKINIANINMDGMPLIKMLEKYGILYLQYKNY